LIRVLELELDWVRGAEPKPASIGRLGGVAALWPAVPLWDCVPRVWCEHRPFGWGCCAVARCGTVFPVSGGGCDCAGGGVPMGLEAVPALCWCGEVSLRGVYIIIVL